MPRRQIITLRREVVRLQDENAELRHDLAAAENERDDAQKELARLSVQPERRELRWPWGCHKPRVCIEARECAAGCATHSGRAIRSALLREAIEGGA